jgi:hypothetical protein
MGAYEDLKMMLNSSDVQAAIDARRGFVDKHLVNGQLLVTKAQLAELQRMGQRESLTDAESWLPSWPSQLDAIPVRVVPEDEPVDVGNNQVAIHRLGSIYVFPKPDYFGPLIETRIIDVS